MKALDRIQSLPVINTAIAIQRRYGSDGGGTLAAAIAYTAFFSLFPLMLFASSVLGFVLAANPELAASIQSHIAGAVPGLSTITNGGLEAVQHNKAATGIIGLAGLLWSGLGIVGISSQAVCAIHRVEVKAGLLRKKLFALVTLFALGGLAIAGIALPVIVAGLTLSGAAAIVVAAATLVVTTGIDFALFVLAYRMLTGGRGPRFAQIWRGALAAAMAWVALKAIGGWYGARIVARSSAVYGAFASTIGVLVLLNLGARVLLYGAEINAHIAQGPGGEVVGIHSKEGRVTSIHDRSTPELVKSIATDAATLVRKKSNSPR